MRLLGEDLINNREDAQIKILNTQIAYQVVIPPPNPTFIPNATSPISKLLGPLDKLNWKQVYKGSNEFILT